MAGVIAVPSVERVTAVIGVAARDRHARARIATALARRSDFIVNTGASASALVHSGSAEDAIVVHCTTVAGDELALFADLRRTAPDVRMVAVCEALDHRSARRAVDAGIDGLVMVERLEAVLEPTLSAVLAGQTAVPCERRASLSKPALSFREKQVLGLVVMGFANGEISAQLFLAESTVKSHLSSAFTKLGVRSRSEAAAMILDPHGSLGAGILAISSAPPPE